MASEPAGKSAVELELQLLRALCQRTGEGNLIKAKAALENYRWRDPTHRTIFAALAEIRSDNPEILRSLLPARLTRKGFPDMPWEELFGPHSLSSEDIERLIQRLLDMK